MSGERSKHIAGVRSLIFWLVLLVLSSLIIADIANFRITVYWIIGLSIIGIGISVYRTMSFQSRTDELLSRGNSFSVYDYKKQTRNLILIIGLTALAFLLPFILAGILGAVFWFASTLGVINGLLAHLVIYNLYILKWERDHGGKIFSVQVWDGSKVTHSGLSFEKYSENR